MSIRAAITEHLWDVARQSAPGDLLPTIAEMGQQFGTSSTQNVRNAYTPLIEAGYVRTIDSPQRRWQLISVPPAAGLSVPELIAQLEEAIAAAQGQLSQLKTALNETHAEERLGD